MNNSTCSVEVCDKPSEHSGWCGSHYERNRRNGTPGTTAIRGHRPYRAPHGPCSVAGCDRIEHSSGYCSGHYIRFTITGDPGPAGFNRYGGFIDHEDGTRTCALCAVRQPLTAYTRASGVSLGRRSACRACLSAENKARRQADPVTYAAVSARARALRKGAVTVERVSRSVLRERDGDACTYCHKTMTFLAAPRYTYNPDQASVDHVIALSRGGEHSYKNTVLCCRDCNTRKKDKPLDVWLGIVNAHETLDRAAIAE